MWYYHSTINYKESYIKHPYNYHKRLFLWLFRGGVAAHKNLLFYYSFVGLCMGDFIGAWYGLMGFGDEFSGWVSSGDYS